MDSCTRLGGLAELKVAEELLVRGYEIFFGWGGKTSCDLVVIKDSNVIRVQVKGTTQKSRYGKWVVQLKSVRSNRTENVIKKFDASLCDLLGVYIEEEDRVVFLEAEALDGMTEKHIA